MQRAVLSFTKEEASRITLLLADNEQQPLLRQKFSTEISEVSGYELSAADADWLLDQLPIPQESSVVELSIRKKLGAFLTQT